jgi:large repetitive protein
MVAAGNQAPQVTAQYPPQNYAVPTLTPELIAGGTDDGQPNRALQYQFALYDSAGSRIALSAVLATGVWQVPAGTLAWGMSYAWVVAAFDGAAWSEPSPGSHFSTAVPQPPVTSRLSQNVGGHGFEPSIGNYTTSAVDAQVATVGPALEVRRFYNSSDPRPSGAFGWGWSSVLDARVSEQKDSAGNLQTVVVTYPDGQQVGFGRNADGSFSPPSGRFASLRPVTGGYTLTDKNATVYAFTRTIATGTFAITSITDASGRAEAFGYNASGQLDTVTAASGRVLHASWATPSGATAAHVRTVATNPAVAGDASTAQTWTYGYTADRLSSMCPPTSATACTTYDYTAASLYPATVADVGPRSYWRLGESSGTVANSAVLANEGSDSGTYANVALGQPGPLPGSTGTAAGFNGTSSSVLLRPGLVSNASYQSVSLWFKTSTANGVLFSYQADPIGTGTTTGSYVPALYIGVDGKLLGKLWTTVWSPPISTPGPVTDGKWHHVVLAGGGNTQAMYLDGTLVGTGSGVIQLYDANGSKNVYVGAGYIGGGWPDEPHQNPNDNTGYAEYFTGQIADVAFYDRWLTGAQASALYGAGHAAARVVKTVTRPSGNTAATVSYDPVTGRVVQVVDENGGTWAVGAPTVSGSSQVFASSVLAAGPAGYWRLADASGPVAANEVNGGTASYGSVLFGPQPGFLLDGKGPFDDASAPGFDGFSSSLALPAGLVPDTGRFSVGMWFRNTRALGGGVLFAEQSQALDATGTCTTCLPALWIGPEGTLRGSVPAAKPTGPMIGMANKCLDLSAFGTVNGTKVQLWTCTGAANQVWQPWPDGTLRNPASGRCLDVSAGGTANGTNVWLWDCIPNAANQLWRPQPDGSWKNPVSGRCLDLNGPSSADGTQAWIWDCYSGPGQKWKASLASAATVTDGKWHHAVLASDGTTQALYLDGAQVSHSAGPALGTVSQPFVYVGAGRTAAGTGTDWTGLPTATEVYFAGAISDVAFYRANLTQAQVGAQFAASKSSTGLTPVQTVTVTDPGGKHLRYDYDAAQGNRLIASTDGLGNTTRYGYDTGGFVHTVTDPNGNVTTTGHDIRGNVVSKTTCQNQAVNACATAYYTYYPDDTSATLTPDPRNDVVLTVRDPRSASATDNTYLTSYTYDTNGNRTGITTPPVPGFPAGRTSTTSYTDGSTVAAVDGGFAPAGLPWQLTSPGGATQTTTYFHNGDLAQTTDAAGLVTKNTYDNLGRPLTKTVVSDSSPAGLVTGYGYDKLNRLASRTDPAVTNRVTGAVHTAKTTTGYDDDGNQTSATVADLTGGDTSRTTSATFNNHDQQITATDAAANTTTFGYDAYGNKTTETDPAGTETDIGYDPNGRAVTTTLKGYTGDPANPGPASDLVLSSNAYDPAGRLASTTDAMGWVTAYTYTDDGRKATTTRKDPAHGTSFVQESNGYDAAGNLVSQTTNNGATTTTTVVDAAGRTASSTVDPTGVNRTTSYLYSADDQVLSTTVADANGASVTDATYDPLGRPTSKTVRDTSLTPNNRWKLDDGTGSTAADADGNQPATASGGVSWSTGHGGSATFDGTGAITTAGPVLDTTKSFTVSAWVNLTDTGDYRVAVQQRGTQQDGFSLRYDKVANRWQFGRWDVDTASPPHHYEANSTTVPATNTWTHLTGVYDATTHGMTLYVNGAAQGTATDPTPFAAAGPLVIGHDIWAGNPCCGWVGGLADVQVYQQALSAAQVGAVYAGTLPAAGSLRTTTTWRLDQRGLPISMTDPNGNITGYAYDEAGRLAVSTGPVVTTETGGGAPAATRPVSMTGYDTFGATTETSDPNGNTKTIGYDADGRPVSVRLPAYTPPGTSTPITPITSTTYNILGQVVTSTDPLGHQTHSTYDQLGNLATVTAPNDGVTHHTYDPLGDRLSTTDPTGAVNQTTYDYLGRKATTTHVVRQPTTVADVTRYAYDTPGGWLSAVTTPAGSTTTHSYNNVGETVAVTDAANNTTRSSYDYAGRTVKTTLPDATAQTVRYDVAGRQTETASVEVNGTVIARQSTAYDAAANPTAVTDARGSTTRFSYDPLRRLAGEVQPVTATTSITTSYGYDAAGNRTRFTDGRGNPFLTTYNPWNLPESTIEPATPAYPNTADRTFTAVYDAAGQLTEQRAPGGVSVTNAYNTIGNLTDQTGAGAETATAARSFGYDLAGRMTTASAPGGTDTFGYDDRGLLLTATGPSGASSFTYTDDGLMASRTDAAGTASYTYDAADRLKTDADPATGTKLSYDYNPLSQIGKITYGTGGNARTLHYDNLHRLTSDTLTTPSGATVASITYGYDLNGNETSKTTTGFASSAANTYSYDLANRLTSWTAGSATTLYAYDNSGNRIQAGSQTYTYNARNQLLTAAGANVTYTARGTLVSIGASTSTSDAFGQTIKQDNQVYAYDALGRAVTDGARALAYSGLGNTVAADGTATYSRDPAGALVGVKTGGTGVLAWTDQHTDVVANFAATGTTLTGSTMYEPFGKVGASTTASGNLGYQSGWTEAATSRVNMAARWYNTATGQFDNRDNVANDPVPNPVAADNYVYADDNPLTMTDPTGHFSFDLDSLNFVGKILHLPKKKMRSIGRPDMQIHPPVQPKHLPPLSKIILDPRNSRLISDIAKHLSPLRPTLVFDHGGGRLIDAPPLDPVEPVPGYCYSVGGPQRSASCPDLPSYTAQPNPVDPTPGYCYAVDGPQRSASCPDLPNNVGTGNAAPGDDDQRPGLTRGVTYNPSHSSIGGTVGLCFSAQWPDMQAWIIKHGKQMCLVYDGDGFAATLSDTETRSTDLFGFGVSTMESNAQSAEDLCGPFRTGSASRSIGGPFSANASGAVGTDSYGRPVVVKEEGVSTGLSYPMPLGGSYGTSNTTHVYRIGSKGSSNGCVVYAVRKLK